MEKGKEMGGGRRNGSCPIHRQAAVTVFVRGLRMSVGAHPGAVGKSVVFIWKPGSR